MLLSCCLDWTSIRHPALIISVRGCSDVIAPILEIIFNASLQNHVASQDWKLANITPTFKKGDHAQPCNYRPISLTCIISKVFEHIIASTIMSHLESNGILYHVQHGFRQHLSCETVTISFSWTSFQQQPWDTHRPSIYGLKKGIWHCASWDYYTNYIGMD